MIYDELPSSWRFVDDEKKLNKNKSCVDCKTELPIVLTTDLALPSFIWKTSGNFFTPLSFILTETTTSAVIDLASEIPNMEVFTISGITYVSSNIINYTTSSTPLLPGVYEAQIWDGLHYIYSEPIQICDDVTHCVQINWTSTCDIAGIPYAHLESIYGTPFLNSMLVVDMMLFSAEYETEKAKFENMLRQVDAFYLSQTRTFSITHFQAPEWFVRAAQVMQLHNTRTVIYDVDNNHQNGLYTTTIEDCEVSSDANESNGIEICNSKLTIKFRQDDAVVSTHCCVNSSPEPCLESCYDVIGFKDDVTPSLGDFAIDDIDSGLIYQWSIVNTWVLVSSECTYVHNVTDDTYLFYDGDSWHVTPDITSVTVTLVQGNFTTIEIVGYTMPGTFVYIGYSAFEGACNYSPIPVTAEQLTNGVRIAVDNTIYYYVCIKSFNNNCEYDERQIHFEL